MAKKTVTVSDLNTEELISRKFDGSDDAEITEQLHQWKKDATDVLKVVGVMVRDLQGEIEKAAHRIRELTAKLETAESVIEDQNAEIQRQRDQITEISEGFLRQKEQLEELEGSSGA